MPIIGEENFHLLLLMMVFPVVPLLAGILVTLWRKL